MDVTEREIEDIFYKFGRIRSIDIKTPSRPPAFAFVSYEDRRDAEDAVHERDGYRFDRERIRVEFAKDDRRDRDRDRDRGRGRDDDRRRPVRTPYRVDISGLPDRTSWQDLKDFMRCGGDIVYADVDRRGGGVVEYSNKEDMLHAVKKNDGAEFDMSYGRSTVTCTAADVRSSSRSRSRSHDRKRRSHSRSRSSSRSRSPERSSRKERGDSRSPSRSRSRSRSPRSDRSRSRSR